MKSWYEEKNAPASGMLLCSLDELCKEGLMEFEFGTCIKTKFRMFLYRTKDDVVGYVNRCPHFNVPLNLSRGDFFTADRSQFQCCHHYATFDKFTGACTDGPCKGRSLTKIPLYIEDGLIAIGEE